MSHMQYPTRKTWLRTGAVAMVLGILLTAACGDESGGGQTSSPSTTLSTSTTATPTTPSTTTTPPTTTAGSPSTTTTTVPPALEPPVINLAGYTTVYSQDGQVRVRGWLDRPAEVTVGGEVVDVLHDQYGGISTFDTVLVLEPGEHGIPVTAPDSSGLHDEIVLSVLVDPGLEVQLALIEEVDMVQRTLVADYVEFLTGDEATIAAREDGMIGENEETPGGFYLRNRNSQLRTLTLGDPGVVTVQACFPEPGPCAAEHAIPIDTWVELTEEPDMAEKQLGWFWYGANLSPYWLTTQDGIVVQIVEQYLP